MSANKDRGDPESEEEKGRKVEDVRAGIRE